MLGGPRCLLPRAVVAAGALAVAAAAAVVAVPAAAEPVGDLPALVGGAPRVISPGVEVFSVARQTPALVGRVARLHPDVVRDRLRVVVSNDAVSEASGPRRETTSSMCRRYRCVVGVNADQWYVSGADISSPIGGTIVEGELVRSPEPNPNEFISMGQLQVDWDGVADARKAPAGWTVELRGGDVTVPLAVNRIPLEGEVALFTHRLGTRTPVDPGVVEWTVDLGAVVQGATPLRATSGDIAGGGNTLAPGKGVIAVRAGGGIGVVGGILGRPDAAVHVDVDGAKWAVGGFPVLMENGEYEIFTSDADNYRRDSRTVAGWTAAGELLLVTVDQRPGWSDGASLVEAAQLLRSLGAVEAINLDGGGSTTFVEGGFVTNRPSDGSDAPVERSVVDALVVVPPEGIDFGTPVPRVPATACPPGQVPPPPFDDLDTAASHLGGIACTAWRSITAGTKASTYEPTVAVSRAQMAAFIQRLLLAAGVALPGTAPDAFVDDQTSVHQAAINRLAAMEIVGGVGGGRFVPEGTVTRAQMATFLARALHVAGAVVFGPQRDYFHDDPLDVHQPNINLVAEHGVAGGVGGTAYDPGGRVSRAQMATFLARALDLALTT